MSKRTNVLATPPSLDEIFSTASGVSAHAKGTFRHAIDDLELANARFADVETQAAVEAARLEDVRAEAAAQRQDNAVVIENLRTLLGE
ncbi:hypothetical protein [Amycolatopsis sp. PS_44_ISF1]|uniref:hypothetical protein n=1 Tax=Amycolatopsis sp. PS_44_ISF1 TaxID=2974917 RepID=UPI0028DDF6AD|nr:hypothetical protein [Amycolatopsis sp. PS_44_ISF1]MDT8915794.1 hypothetical protein [Amycolatopsis sp. PS_44_ISF1]MDT8916198.1 hypothetical protein [Amycolatopsis sp. PS_44_ISF1]